MMNDSILLAYTSKYETVVVCRCCVTFRVEPLVASAVFTSRIGTKLFN